MCHKLLQMYACNHSKTICVTPCPHALNTTYRLPQSNSDNSVSHSNSTVSSIAPSVRREELPRIARSSMASPLRTYSPPVQAPAFRFVPPGQPLPVERPLNFPGHSPKIPASPISTWSTPLFTSAASLPSPLQEPNFCLYHFLRYLLQSNHPCIDCYMLPEWENLSGRWMRQYRQDHPMEKQEDVERWSGIEALMERERHRGKEMEGLLNVFVDGDESAGRIV